MNENAMHINTSRRGIAPITKLPAEVTTEILACLDSQALKALRLTRRAFVPFCTAILFRQIYISRLWKDRLSFFNIASTPHLAAVVRSVVWLELVSNVLDLNILYTEGTQGLPEGPEPPKCEWTRDLGPVWEGLPEEETQLYRHLFHQSIALFWLHIPQQSPWPIFDSYEEEWEALTDAEEEFFPQFYNALRLMTGVFTFVSQPMHPFRRLSTGEGYPLTAQLFYGPKTRTPNWYNYGYMTFLQPAMQKLASDSVSAPVITHLHFADESTRALPAFARTAVYRRGMGDEPDAFRHLTHLDLCLVPFDYPSFPLVPHNREYSGEWHVLGECLSVAIKSATRLTHLRLCFERCFWERVKVDNSPPDVIAPPEDFLKHLPVIPQLVSLHLDSVPLAVDILVEVIRNHKDTLRVLELIPDPDYSHYPGFMDLSHIEGLRLESYVVELDEEDDLPGRACDPLVSLRVIKKSGPFDDDAALSSNESWDSESLEYASSLSDEEMVDVY
jgi:hypothetical protein